MVEVSSPKADQARRDTAKKANSDKVGRLKVQEKLGQACRKSQKWLEELFAISLKWS